MAGVRAVLFRTLAMLALLGSAHAAEQQPGTRIEVRPDALPAPNATPSVSNSPRVVPRPPGATLAVPRGFQANLFAEGLKHARNLLVASNGDVFLAEPDAGRITLLRDADGDGRAELRETFATGLKQPHGLAVHGGFLYVADLDRVWRLPYRPGNPKAAGDKEPVTPPGALGDAGGHWTRNLAIHPRGDRLYVAIGSRGNIEVEPEPRATIQEFRLDGRGQRTFAAGLRNPVGIAFRPGTDELWTVVNERDRMGDGLVPDYFTRVKDGGFYGWPYAYIGPNPQPGFAQRAPDLVKRTIVPDLLFESHSAPLGLAFYDGTAFPPEYRGNAFVGLHGSWNSGRPVGYMVARVPLRDGRPIGHYEVFASGFRTRGEDKAQVWGRPVGIAVAKDGSLLVADDVGQTIWRIAWTGRTRTPP